MLFLRRHIKYRFYSSRLKTQNCSFPQIQQLFSALKGQSHKNNFEIIALNDRFGQNADTSLIF
jgi:hypothetical protein